MQVKLPVKTFIGSISWSRLLLNAVVVVVSHPCCMVWTGRKGAGSPLAATTTVVHAAGLLKVGVGRWAHIGWQVMASGCSGVNLKIRTTLVAWRHRGGLSGVVAVVLAKLVVLLGLGIGASWGWHVLVKAV